MKISIAQVNNFFAVAQAWATEENNRKTKLAYAIGRVTPRIQTQLRLYSNEREDIAADTAVLIEDINLELCATNDKGHVLRDDKGALIFEPEKEKKRNKRRRELEKKRDDDQRKLFETEDKFEIEPYYATEIPESLSEYEKALFEGYVIKAEEEPDTSQGTDYQRSIVDGTIQRPE